MSELMKKMLKKYPSRERWYFNERIKELNRKELEEVAWYNRKWTNIWSALFFMGIIVSAMVMVIGLVPIMEEQIDEKRDVLIQMGEYICEDKYGEKFTDMTEFKNRISIQCETRLFTVGEEYDYD